MAVAFGAIAVAVSCEPAGPDNPGKSGEEQNTLWTSVPVSTAAGSQYLTVIASSDWTLSVIYPDSKEEWLTLSPMSGKAGTKKVAMSWTKNEADDSRECEIALSAGKYSDTLSFAQAGVKTPVNEVTELVADPVPQWMELPKTDDPDLYFITHDMDLNGKKVRNYSLYLDPEACLAVWVAYPLNSGLIGKGDRTDAWNLDPKVPRRYQPVLFKGFPGYDRGHQLPSADRLNREANKATFYFTNMTPQLGALNQRSWANFEGMVRSWSANFDTLYVVTGCDLQGYTKVAYDNDSKPIPVPVGYFKALLGYKKSGTSGKTATQGGYTAIGFYFSHQAYSNSEIMGQKTTIDELEEMMGIDFFPNLEASIGKDLYDKVESTMDSWWK